MTGQMIQWGEPLWLIGLIALAALLVAELLWAVVRRREERRFARAEMLARLMPGRSPGLRRARRVLFYAAVAALLVGLANPRVGTRYEEVSRQGVDIVLAVDVSQSMAVTDIRPSRIAKTRYELARFLEGLKGDRIGIVPFAGTAYPLLPMTLDYAAARTFLDLLATDLIPTAGTAIGEAIRTSLALLPDEPGSKRGRAIVLVSDGEDHEGEAVEMARQAAKRGVVIHSIGMALGKGDPIPVLDEQGQRSGWMTDDEGQIVTSRLNEDLLRQIAEATGGSYRRADQGAEAFRSVYKEIFRLDREEFEQMQITGHEDRFQWLLALALALLLGQSLLPTGRRGRKGPRAGSLAGLLLLAGALLLSPDAARAETAHGLVKKGNTDVANGELDEALLRYLEARAQVDSSRPEIDYNLGGVYARKGDAARADSILRSLPPESRRELRARAHYNRGTAHAEAEQYDKAVEAFVESLKLDPGDYDSKTNLELALRRQQQQQQQQEQNQDENQDENQDQDQKQDQQQDQQEQDQQQDQQDQQQQQQDPSEQEEQKQQKPQPQELDRELAERLLDQLEQDEKELLKEVVRKQIPRSKRKSDKPW